MTNISKKKLSVKMQNKLFIQFAHIFVATNETHIAALFESLFTDAEKIMFVKRVAIILMLSKGISTYAISKSLHVSDATARTIRDNYETGMYGPIVNISKRKSFDSVKFWKTVEILLHAGMPPQGKDRWKWLT